MKKVFEIFKHPGTEFRGKPFWAWNGKLEPLELRRQIRIMHAMGLGGFFMHSRVGLDTPYLSDEWFQCINACIDEAKKYNMEAWLYDEDRWPSGAAGGIVTKNPQYRMRSLVVEVVKNSKKLKWDRNTLAVFAARVSGTTAACVRSIPRGGRVSSLGKGESLLVFRKKIHECSSWYNGFSYLDTLNHDAVKQFISVTHDAYRKNCGKYFGTVIPGIFTDEPNYDTTGGEDNIPWTDKLPVVFRERYGYDILRHLVELFFDVDGEPVTRARYHYHDCITHLFVDAFSRQISQWCDKNNVMHTGHVLAEETLSSQTSAVGSCMRFYEYMQAPGIDILTEHQREYDTAKQVSSVARQFGRKWRITETYGCTGWDFSFAGHKAIGDWQAALGINLRCQHLSLYTMEGEAKRDYPASIFYQSPWWMFYPKVEDYFARIHAVMTQGEEVRDLLVIHPVESMWMLCRKDWKRDPEVSRYDEMLIELRDSLLEGGIDFDYGDEDILSRHGKVEAGNVIPSLIVGKARYKAVIVPPLKTVRHSTLSLLKKFRSAGGTVVFAGQACEFVNALPSKEAIAFSKMCERVPAGGKGIVKSVEKTCRRISITDTSGKNIAPVLYLLREDKEAFHLFICNTGSRFKKGLNDTPVCERRKHFPDVNISGFSGCKGMPLELNPDTGEVFTAKAKSSKDGWCISTSLPRLGSRLFVVPKKKLAQRYAQEKIFRDVRKKSMGTLWNIALSECNNLVLDRPRYRIGDGSWQKAKDILLIDRDVRDALKVPHRGGRMVQPWAQKKRLGQMRVPVTLAYNFTVKALPAGELFLAIEQPRRFQISINNIPVPADAECGWWVDRSLRKLPIDSALLHIGTNKITLLCNYEESHPGFETMYLLGNFGTAVKGTEILLTKLPDSLRTGNWVKQGLAFYSGSVCYVKKIRVQFKTGQHVFLQVPHYEGAAVRVLVNGTVAGIIGWEPNELDITNLLKSGDSAILCIEVLGHRRNSHGPFHLKEKRPQWTGPSEFTPDKSCFFEAYQLVPCGLMRTPQLVVRREGYSI